MLIRQFAPYSATGMMHGEELSAAYASADIFVMPSETETLGERASNGSYTYCRMGCRVMQGRRFCHAFRDPGPG